MEQIDLDVDKVLNWIMLSGIAPDWNNYIGVALLAALLFFYLLISGAEAAFLATTAFQNQQMKENGGKAEQLFAWLLERPTQFLATILLLKFGAIYLSGYLLTSYLSVSMNIWMLLLCVFGAAFLCDMAVKKYAKINTLNFAKLSGYPMYALFFLCYPVTILFALLFGRKMSGTQSNVSLDEISDAIENVDVIDVDIEEQEDAKLLKGVVRFGETEAKEIMRSRSDVVAVEKSMSLEKVLQIISDSGYTRVPVYEEDLDNVLGILVFKDFLPYFIENKEFDWISLMRPAFFVSENKLIDELLQEFQKKKTHFAIVVDEYGGTSGIVTLEDVLEEIVGEIDDEYDESEDGIQYRQIDDRTWQFAAKTHISDFCKIVHLKDDDCFEEVRGDADSLGGLILELLGRLPKEGEEVRYKAFTFETEEVDDRRILSLLIRIAKNGEGNGHDKDEK